MSNKFVAGGTGGGVASRGIDSKIPLESPVRFRYYASAQLTASDLQCAQDYFIGKQRLHSRLLHGTGVVMGLDVSAAGETDSAPGVICLGEGVALDGYGREIIVPRPTQLNLNSKFKPEEVGEGRDLFVWIGYDEVVTDRSDGKGGGNIMVVESFKADAGWVPPPDSSLEFVVLARVMVKVEGGRIVVSGVDNAVRGGLRLRKELPHGDGFKE